MCLARLLSEENLSLCWMTHVFVNVFLHVMHSHVKWIFCSFFLVSFCQKKWTAGMLNGQQSCFIRSMMLLLIHNQICGNDWQLQARDLETSSSNPVCKWIVRFSWVTNPNLNEQFWALHQPELCQHQDGQQQTLIHTGQSCQSACNICQWESNSTFSQLVPT